MSFSCHGDREGTVATPVSTHPTRVGRSGFVLRRAVDMDCRRERGGFEFLSLHNARTSGDNDDWGWRWGCMDGTTGSGGPQFTSERGTERQLVSLTVCPTSSPKKLLYNSPGLPSTSH